MTSQVTEVPLGARQTPSSNNLLGAWFSVQPRRGVVAVKFCPNGVKSGPLDFFTLSSYINRRDEASNHFKHDIRPEEQLKENIKNITNFPES